MIDDSPLLDRARIEEAFRRLGDRLVRRGVIADAEHLLAMKVLASRQRDADDIALLIKQLGISDVESALAVVHRVSPTSRFPTGRGYC